MPRVAKESRKRSNEVKVVDESKQRKIEDANKENLDADNLTLEGHLQSQCDVLIKFIQDRGQSALEDLRSQAEQGIKEIEEAGKTSDDSAKSDPEPMIRKGKLVLQVLAGIYTGKTYELALEEGVACLVGRSSGKKYQGPHGLSLKDDPEVSTAHSKIEMLDNQVYYTDVGSTNGSSINGKTVEAQVPMPLKNGDILGVGGTKMEVTLEVEQ